MKELYVFKKKEAANAKILFSFSDDNNKYNLNKYRNISDAETVNKECLFHILLGTEIIGIAFSLEEAEKGQLYIQHLYENDKAEQPLSIVRKESSDEESPNFIPKKRGLRRLFKKNSGEKQLEERKLIFVEIE